MASEYQPHEEAAHADPLAHATRFFEVTRAIEDGAQVFFTKEQITAIQKAHEGESPAEEQGTIPDKSEALGNGVVALAFYNPLEHDVKRPQDEVTAERDHEKSLHEKITAITGPYSSLLYTKVPPVEFNERTRFRNKLKTGSTRGPSWEIEREVGDLETRNIFQLYYLQGEKHNTLDKVEFSIVDEAEDLSRYAKSDRPREHFIMRFRPDGSMSEIDIPRVYSNSKFLKEFLHEPYEGPSNSIAKFHNYIKHMSSFADPNRLTIKFGNEDTEVPTIIHTKLITQVIGTTTQKEMSRHEYNERRAAFILRGDNNRSAKELSVDDFLEIVQGILQLIPIQPDV